MNKWLLVGAVGLSGATALIWTVTVGAPGGSDNGPVKADLVRGAAIYADACASCHGANLEGEPDWRFTGADGRLPAPPHDASGHTWHHPDQVLLDITRRGTAAVVGGGYQSNMPGFAGTYSEDELRDVLEWIKTRWSEPGADASGTDHSAGKGEAIAGRLRDDRDNDKDPGAGRVLPRHAPDRPDSAVWITTIRGGASHLLVV